MLASRPADRRPAPEAGHPGAGRQCGADTGVAVARGTAARPRAPARRKQRPLGVWQVPAARASCP